MLQLLSPYKVIFVKEYVTQRLEYDLILGATHTSLPDKHSRNSDSLESSHYSGRSADYAWQLILNTCGLLALNMPLGSMLHFRPLLLSLVTLSARLTPHARTSIFGLITLSHEYLPYALVAMDLVMTGPSAAATSLTGVISGYAWWYLVHNIDAGRPGAEFARAPAWLKGLIRGDGEAVVPGVGRVINAGGERAAAAGRATARAATGAYNWGTGQRLGNN
ncbi:hypothetical protein EW145_g1211 [Phellinidium pouzarii]|uniref:Derlin n=1 Tax=Phellinidium pouzarii TaxID=167371 RepID=A0A4S4LKX6_9AGAM|nr:hypothetical protein EW145_g1211 [Phellinidium pouzarii]